MILKVKSFRKISAAAVAATGNLSRSLCQRGRVSLLADILLRTVPCSHLPCVSSHLCGYLHSIPLSSSAIQWERFNHLMFIDYKLGLKGTNLCSKGQSCQIHTYLQLSPVFQNQNRLSVSSSFCSHYMNDFDSTLHLSGVCTSVPTRPIQSLRN